MKKIYTHPFYSWILLAIKSVNVLMFAVSPLFHHHEPKQDTHGHSSFHSHVLADENSHEAHDADNRSDLLLDHLQVSQNNFDNCLSCHIPFTAFLQSTGLIVYPNILVSVQKIFYERIFDPISSSCFLFYSDASPPLA